MIAAFARAARVIRTRGGGSVAADPYRAAARRAADFIADRMWDAGSGTLWRRFRDGRAEIAAYAEDYACLVFGLIELFQADPDPRWLTWAAALQRRQDELFWDEENGGWYGTTGSDSSILLRMKDDYDGAEPGASSVSVMNLLVLSHLIESPDWGDKIDRTLRLFGSRLERIGRAVPMMAAALSTYWAGLQQIVIVGDDGSELQRVVAARYLPFATKLTLDREQQAKLEAVLPLVAAMRPQRGAVAYVCRNFSCRPPAGSAAELEKELRA